MGSYHLIITDFILCNKCFYMYTKLCVYIYIQLYQINILYTFNSVQSLSCVQLFVTP